VKDVEDVEDVEDVGLIRRHDVIQLTAMTHLDPAVVGGAMPP
jgi:hypothetical protein